MSRLIAGVYEIKQQIGAGGGGVVYLGRHVRLNKNVVLKADKRKLSASTDSLRREVDILKNFSHTYIPQVYDFIQEDGVVYTVMDYISGESFDKILANNTKISQPDVVKWACQLLEALDYLHSQPPYGVLHGDIKPANIMLKPNGDICLIDYNIALALGEDGAVKVGFSRGYASPEHYGADYIKSNKQAAVRKTTTAVITSNSYGEEIKETGSGKKSQDADETMLLDEKLTDTDETMLLDTGSRDEDTTVLLGYRTESAANATLSKNIVNQDIFSNNEKEYSTQEKKGIMLDVRSDIFSLGATLYHILSGKRPNNDARLVVPLDKDDCSLAISRIIQKSMAPQPDMRYQSAKEMLNDFLNLYKIDERAVRHRRRMLVTYTGLATLFIAGGASAFIGQSRLKQEKDALVMAEYSADALKKGDVSAAIEYALLTFPQKNNILNPPFLPQGQKALTDALGVYDLADEFKPYDTFEIKAVPFHTAISPNGVYLAAEYAYELAIFDISSKKLITTLPIQESALSDAVFISDNVIIYAGNKGVCAYDIVREKELWTGDIATGLALSGDRQSIAAVNREDDYATIYNTEDGTKLYVCSFNGKSRPVPYNDIFADADNSIFSLNYDGSYLAVSFKNGEMEIYNLCDEEKKIALQDETAYQRLNGGFYGKYFAYICNNPDKSVFGIIDLDKLEYVGGYESMDEFVLEANNEGIFLANKNVLINFNPETFEEKELAYVNDKNIVKFTIGKNFTLVADEDNHVSFYDKAANRISVNDFDKAVEFTGLNGMYAILANRNEPLVKVLKLKSHEDSVLMKYDMEYAHDEARVSADEKTVVFYDYQGMTVYDMNGSRISRVSFPNAEYIYDQQFVKDGKTSSLEVIWYDGKVRYYSAANGEIVSEKIIEPPAKDLYEEFYTSEYKIESVLHETAKAYDIKTNKFVKAMEEDAYLTYVTEWKDYIIAEYMDSAGDRYGMLLNRKLETLAYLPKLCDITNDCLVFDYGANGIRTSPVYSLDELMKMAYEK